MKIGILTHPLGTNYGGILQAYALSSYLMSQGHEVIVLNRQSNHSIVGCYVKAIMMLLRHPRYNNPKFKHLKQFVANYINCSKPIFTDAQMSKFVRDNQIEIVIVGSDQVWRKSFAMMYGYNYFLDFVPTGIRKMSYAASFGLRNWEYDREQTSRIKQLVSEFNALSVREIEGVLLLQEQLGIKAEHVLDPTMLLQAKDYKLITSDRLVDEDYIFVYWLGCIEEKNKALRSIDCSGKKIIDCSVRNMNILISIQEWLSYIQHAEYIVTDSFHGCVFSILFQKQFTIWKNESGGNGRLDSLFSVLKIQPNVSINYEKINPILDGLRIESLRYLHSSLGIL